MVAGTSSSRSRAAVGSTSRAANRIADQDTPHSSWPRMSGGGMLFSVRLSHWTASRSPWSSSAMRRPCHPPRALPVTGSVTPGLTTTLSPIAQLLLPIASLLVACHVAPVILVYHSLFVSILSGPGHPATSPFIYFHP